MLPRFFIYFKGCDNTHGISLMTVHAWHSILSYSLCLTLGDQCWLPPLSPESAEAWGMSSGWQEAFAEEDAGVWAACARDCSAAVLIGMLNMLRQHGALLSWSSLKGACL